jgi:hypothetical protein
MASKSKIIAELFEADGDIIASALDNVVVTPTAISDQANTSTGGFTMPSGTTAQRPGSPDTGESRYNSTTGSLEFYDGSAWISTNLIPTLDSVTGNITAGFGTGLTLAVSNATDNIDIVFKEGATALATVTGRPVSSGSVTVDVPAAVYGQSAGDTITISITNVDGTPSSNSQTSVIKSLPTGGTITTVGNYRVHTFTSSGTLSIGNLAVSADLLMVAGGGGGGAGGQGSTHSAAGGGAGGMYNSTSQTLSASTNYTVTIGSGGSGSSNSTNKGDTGGNTSFTGQTTAAGGGGGGSRGSNVSGTHPGNNGGSGGGSVGDSGTYSGGTGTSGQGNNGGAVNRNLSRAASAGGGKGAIGGSPVDHLGTGDSINGAAGGAGATNNYRTGSNVSYAGGGGSGACLVGSAQGTAGASGVPANGGSGGDAGNSGQGGGGGANTGQGGGGANSGSLIGGTTNGGNGGSGICVVRYNAAAL